MEQKKLLREEIKFGIIGDIVFEDSILVDFLRICLQQCGGMSQIGRMLRSLGYINFSDYAYRIFTQTHRSGVLEILEFDVEEIHEICRSIIHVLISMDDLSTLTTLSNEHAIECLDKLSQLGANQYICLLYTSPSPRDGLLSRMPSSA